jgi:methionyl-tRNA synthetase
MSTPFYITTAIPYVNGAPHLGHALELVHADVVARHARLRGRAVRFLTGTDDNALKNVVAARAAGVPVAAFVAANAARFAALRELLSLSVDDVIHTGSDPRHRAGVQRLWRRSAAAGDFYRRRYTGRYCLGCEGFLDADTCAEHAVPTEPVAEENWFFRLSRYASAIAEAINTGRLRIEPATRRNEVLALLESGLSDISVSRPAGRAAGWGIPVPDDPGEVVYVWWDALVNYVSALGEGSDLATWWTGGERVHVIGKGILRFHAVVWPAILLSTGLPLPDALYVHPYLGVDGVKISKTAGNAVDPVEVVRRFGTDALRWWLAREVARDADVDFTEHRLVARVDRELANGLGNLVHRILALAHRNGGRLTGAPTGALAAASAALPALVDTALARFDVRGAATAIWDVVAAGNRIVTRERPWELAADDPALADLLTSLVHACRTITTEIEPFLPDAAPRLRARLGEGDRVGRGEPVFPRLADRIGAASGGGRF